VTGLIHEEAMLPPRRAIPLHTVRVCAALQQSQQQNTKLVTRRNNRSGGSGTNTIELSNGSGVVAGILGIMVHEQLGTMKDIGLPQP
jgi:hypothetical protein